MPLLNEPSLCASLCDCVVCKLQQGLGTIKAALGAVRDEVLSASKS